VSLALPILVRRLGRRGVRVPRDVSARSRHIGTDD